MNTRYAKAALVAISMLLLWSVFPAATGSWGDSRAAALVLPELAVVQGPIECGQTLPGDISSDGDQDTYTFTANAGEAVNISAVATSGTLCARAELYSPSGSLIGATSVFNCNTNFSVGLPTTGVYTILVRDRELNKTGMYNVNLQFTTGRCGATVSCGETRSSNISDKAEQDTYTFTANAGEAVNISAVATSGDLCARAELYAPSGALIGATSVFNCDTNFSVGLPTTGIYTILVRDRELNKTGQYNLNLQFTTGRCGTTVSCGETKSNNISGKAEQDTYRFCGTQNSSVVISAVATSGDLCARAELYAPSGALIGATSVFNCNTNFSVGLPATGVYTILVRDRELNKAGTYNVNLSCIGPTCPSPPPLLIALNPDALTVAPGASGGMNVTINAAQGADTVVSLSSSNPAIALVPASVTIQAGQTSEPFTVTGVARGLTTIIATLPPSLGSGMAAAIVKVVAPTGLAPTCAITPSGPFTVNAGTPVSFVVTGTDVDAGAMLTLNTGGLPQGATMTPSLPVTGPSGVSSTFNWTPTTASNNVVNFSVTDETSQQSLCSATINVVVPCPVITVNPPTIPPGIIGQPYSQTFTQTGGAGSTTFSLTGALPAGLNFTTAGVLSGTPTTSGSFPITIKATDQTGCVGTRDYTLMITNPAPTLASLSPSSATAGGAAFTLTVNGANFVSNSKVLWNGSERATTFVSPTQLTAVITSADIAAPSMASVTVFNPAPGGGVSDPLSFNVSGCPAIIVNPPTIPVGISGQPYSQSFTQTGGTGSVTFSLTRVLPPGLSLTTAGVLSGTPTESGSFSITIKATDQNGCMGTRDYTLVIVGPGGPGGPGGPVGPGASFPAVSEVSDQKAGSVLVYNLYSSSAAAPQTQNTRISVTNINPTLDIAVHLFFVDGQTCSIADAIICLTKNQTASFLASDLDPGTTGYIVAIASDPTTGCPVNFNFLIGDEYVKLSSGHQANLGAEAFSALAGGLTFCNQFSVTAQLNFDGVSYNRAPRTLAASSIPARTDGNDTLLVINRFGGNLATGAATLSNLFGIFYDDAENAVSFTFSPGTCQFRSSLSSNFPRTTPRLETFIPAGRSGWLRLYSTSNIGLLGAILNFNPTAGMNASTFNQGRNLHKLTLTSTQTLVIPIFPANCLD